MGLPAARLSDMHTCPMVTGVVPHVGGPVMPVMQVTVLTGMLPQARAGDMCICVGPPDTIIPPCAFNVLVVGKPAARLTDMTAHGGVIVGPGMPNVLIGTVPSPSVVPPQMSKVILPPGADSNGVAVGAFAKTKVSAAQANKPFCAECAKHGNG